MNERINIIDVVKLFFAICIIMIHTAVLQDISITVWRYFTGIILRLAVPFFFISSGFFLGGKIYRKEPKETILIIKKYCIKLTRPLFLFEGLSIALNFVSNYIMGKYNTQDEVLSDIILQIKCIIFYPNSALWYIQACIVGAILAGFFIYYNKFYLGLLFSGILFMIAAMGNTYYWVLNFGVLRYLRLFVDFWRTNFFSLRNGIFVGFFYINLGIASNQIFDKFKQRVSIHQLGGVLVLFYLIYIIEVVISINIPLGSVDDQSLYIMPVILIPTFIFWLICIDKNMPIKSSVADLCRFLSSRFYFTHKIVLAAISTIAFILKINLTFSQSFLLVMIILTIMCSYSFCRKRGLLFNIFSH